MPWSQRGQRTTCCPQCAQLNRRPKFFIAAVDENGLDPRKIPHDTVHTGRARHGSGGAASALASKQTGRRRIVLSARSLPPPLLLSGLQNCRRRGRRNQNRDRCPLWINRLALPDSRAVAAASRFTHSSAEAPIQPTIWLLQRHPTLATNSPSKRTSPQPPTGGSTACARSRCRQRIYRMIARMPAAEDPSGPQPPVPGKPRDRRRALPEARSIGITTDRLP